MAWQYTELIKRWNQIIYLTNKQEAEQYTEISNMRPNCVQN